MRVTIFGSGYVGLVTGACLADAGNHVMCVDVDAAKIERLKRGEVPIHEPGLDALIKRNEEAGRIEFTTDAPRAVEHGLFQLIAVGTPPGEDGSADLRYVLTVARTIATHMKRYCIVVTKSTVPVGTADKVRTERDRRAGRGRYREGEDWHRLGSPHRLQLHLPRHRLRRLLLPEGRAGLDPLGP